jgi:hypothetical protein
VFAALVYFSPERQEQDVLLSGVVAAVQEQDGIVRALAVDAQGQRIVVRVTGQYLQHAPSPTLAANQEVDLKVTSFKAVKQGVSCELVQVVRAGEVRPAPDQSAEAASASPGQQGPQGKAALPVDDLKSVFGFKGM